MLYYLYGITSSDNSLSAVPAASVEKVVCSGLTALVEPVADGDFAPDALEVSLGSLDLVARTARKHEALLEAAMASGPVLPARLCTLFKDTGAVLRSLTDNHPRLSSMLGRLRHRSEWGLKVYCDIGGDPSTVGPTYYQVVWQRIFNASDTDIHGRLVSSTGVPLGSGVTYIDNSSGTYDQIPRISNSNGLPLRTGTAWEPSASAR